MKRFFTILILIGSVACSKGFESANPTPTPEPTEEISMNGSWVSCFPVDTSNTQKVEITILGSNLSETISSYSNLDCSGTADSQFSFTAQVSFGPFFQSTFEPNATDVTLVVDGLDLFGCGVGNPGYTYFRIENNVGFNAAANQPSCDPNARGSGIGPYYLKTAN